MSKMCHACESEETTLDEVHIGLTCSNYCCQKCNRGEKTSVINGETDWLNMDASPCSTPYGTPIFSRESSFSSFASCFSSLGDSLMDSESEEEIEPQDTGQLNPDTLVSDELMEQGKGSSIQVDECQLSHVAVVDDDDSFHIPTNQNISSGQQCLETHEDATKENFDATNIILDSNVSFEPHRDILCNDQSTEIAYGVSVEDIDIKQSDMIHVEEGTSLPMSGDEIIPLNEQVTDQLDSTKENTIVYNNILSTEPDMKPGADFDNGNECLYPPVFPNFDADPLIWLPPEPANKEDDIYIVSNNDDESDNNSTEWGRSSFSASFAERSKESHEDQLQKVMSEVMNGQFKILVSRFLAAEGFSLSDGGTDKSWLDIVASLSWDAALLVKPDANSGNAMDPGLYVKVKRIASGSCQQSEVINGLVFKKSAAHKQMRASIKHPKLLLLQGSLGHSSSGLSSINSMKQENEQLEKTLSEVIIKCQPDLILVEKAVSRNVNEYIQKQGVTVVSDMNIHRLERIARCTGSPIILLQDVLTKPNLIKQCESLHFEKFVEEHNITGEDGRRTPKTFLFLEGFPKPLGCTILLKGSTSEELEKIKRVLQFTVFAAYHLILETSFFADQKLFMTDGITKGKENCFETDRQLPASYYDSSKNSDTMKHNISTCDGQYANQEDFVHTENTMSLHLHDSNIKTSRDPADGELVDIKAIQSYSSLPVLDPSTNSIRNISSSDCPKSTTCDGFDGSTFTATSKKVTRKEECGEDCQEIVNDGMCTETGPALNTQNILISMSSQHIRNQAVCEQSHLSRITYYGYFDTSLGRYLQDTLLNEKHNCFSCGEPPEAHMYSYTHHNGTLTVLVKRLPLESTLSGGGQGRIWMWTRCLKCHAKPTQRVIISSSARNLSFGKFLELSFSTHSAAKKLSTCGHLLHRDCLRFFGFGSKVAMFRYSSVEIYSACKPPLTLEFNNQNRKDWLDVEVKTVLLQWKLLFSEIENAIQDLKSRCSSHGVGENTSISVYGGLLLEVTRMLRQEKNEVEVSMNEFGQIVKPESCAHEILGLNWLYQQLLLGFYIWDVRLHHILQYSKVNAASSDNSVHKSTVENELMNSEVAVRDTPSMKELGVEREEATINSCNSFDNSCGGVISDKAQLTDKSIIKEHESPVYPDLVVRISPASPGEVSVPFTNDEQPATSRVNEMYHIVIPSDDTGKWVWNRFSHLEMEYKKELQGGSLDKFHLINKYNPSSSPLTHPKHQMGLGHFIVGPGGSILSIAEEEISSLIAYALTISEQQGFYSGATFAKDELVDRRKTDKLASSNLDRDASLLSSILSPDYTLEKNHNLSRNASTLSSEESTSGFYDSFLSALKDLHPEICANNEKIALKSKYTVVSIYAKQFRDLRKICCPSELAYISSISRCKRWNAQGGKSKVFFAKTMDDRFIIKQIKKTEFDSFLKFGLEYFKHFGVSQVSSNPTCLAKIMGIYQVKEIRNGKETRVNFMIMENLLFGHDIIRRYDLKGALFSRYVPDSKNPEKVLLDQNFIEDMRTMPIYIEGKAKNLMERAIWNDTSFLSRMTVMDYSLFVGVDKQKKELVFGIIDYLRQYTWDKQLESWVKTSLVVPKNLSPTVISPREYKIRFRAFMSQYFLSVSDA
ncbi:1-phosphatidylinositol-3-phosphate 5-kinase FAB1A-like [Phragmites australis]|uniref:1-phosphatidylinositol-3-phosphate 5-kinase FAB1A-like n=1 Tax=Phragmites australis TaxID=29695 RepID=UPI002D777C78|nr:1-phosphatidylinositol-3-phosphate 5-kinase FAB1A-like [Phragmites australis]XP_062227372.1 1-phosphatidylinositol-3-phosphate 5-kinase FAB1A-like [Phragmites australis]XP_062227375.1 1-phosphatidylinositol-3-phosphate 5-kinase FAB1A-like [Phragmites australis]XP_062227378.1 1-phosphatidylinositol-3-phosphate 5-kinase FAB1A-like [Phragmites australis]XP_062227382.1 1-phosphatidylinositol-3-phosphate 5-kinase FAB1A-like [Phragmites australis]XP_062227386.1 1-phosphatidylinositol-3-phosphate 